MNEGHRPLASRPRTARAGCTPVAPRRPIATLLLSHGAGGGIESRDLVGAGRRAARAGRLGRAVRAAVAGRRPQGRDRAADPRRGAACAADVMRVRTPLVVGGRSAGARSAARTRPLARGHRLPGPVLPAAPAGPHRAHPAPRAARRRPAHPASSRASATRWAVPRSSPTTSSGSTGRGAGRRPRAEGARAGRREPGRGDGDRGRVDAGVAGARGRRESPGWGEVLGPVCSH